MGGLPVLAIWELLQLAQILSGFALTEDNDLATASGTFSTKWTYHFMGGVTFESHTNVVETLGTIEGEDLFIACPLEKMLDGGQAGAARCTTPRPLPFMLPRRRGHQPPTCHLPLCEGHMVPDPTMGRHWSCRAVGE